MLRLIVCIGFGVLLFSGTAMAACTVPNLLQNTYTADANAVMGNFNSLIGCFANPAFTGTATFPGPVGIGTSSPTRPLTVDGNSGAGQIGLWNSANTSMVAGLGVNGANNQIITGDNIGDLAIWSGGGTSNKIAFSASTGVGEQLVITHSGNVGIGTSSPGYTLEVNGSAAKPGGGSWSSSSDRRLKTDIRAVESAMALAKLNQLNPVTFNWINPQMHGKEQKPGGFVAQQLAQVFPEFVHSTSCQGADCSLVGGEKSKEYNLSLPFKFDAYLVAGIQELSKRVDKLSAAQAKTSFLVMAEHGSRKVSSNADAVSNVKFLSALKELKAANDSQSAQLTKLEGEVSALQRRLAVRTAQR